MGSTERIKNVAKRVAKWARAGHQMVVVPSAMSGETNRLLGLAKELQPSLTTQHSLRELDAVAATGEQVSVGLLALALQAQGVEAGAFQRQGAKDAGAQPGVIGRRKMRRMVHAASCDSRQQKAMLTRPTEERLHD